MIGDLGGYYLGSMIEQRAVLEVSDYLQEKAH